LISTTSSMSITWAVLRDTSDPSTPSSFARKYLHICLFYLFIFLRDYDDSSFHTRTHALTISIANICTHTRSDGKSYASGSEDGYVRLHHFERSYFNPRKGAN
jgi:hypothetical protein